MTRTRQTSFLVVLLTVGLAGTVLPGRAQQSSDRFFFADTTLLRDTLDLRFEGLFELADSLRIRPDTLRAISVRYRYGLERIVWLSDSLGLPVDSVGPVMLREMFNPLAARGERSSAFGYTSTYTLGQTSTTWINSSDYNLVNGPLFVRNTTAINIDRFLVGQRTTLRQTRNSATEAGWKLSQDLSLGGRANLTRFNSNAPGQISSENESINEFEFSARSRQRPGRGMTSELNLFSGLVDVSRPALDKKGLSGDLNGRFRINRSWFTHDLNGQLKGDVARTRVPGSVSQFSTNDMSQNLRGSLGMFSNAPVSANLNYSLRRVRVETPTDSGLVQEVLSSNNLADLTLRLRQTSERYLNLGARVSSSDQSNSVNPNAQTSRSDLGFTSDGRYRLWNTLFEARLGFTFSSSEFPRRSNAGGYGESLSVRTFEISAQRSITSKIVARATGNVSLNRFRYFTLGGTTPVPRDQYRQSYRLEGTYTRSQNFNSGLILDVARALFVNIPSASTGANNEVRTYRAEWRWTYRLMPGLTATQSNNILADYTFFTFIPQNNRLSMDYTTRTIFNAVLSPRLSLDVIHSARFQPAGDYLREEDGLQYFSPADETENFTIGVLVNYAPSPLVTLRIQPEYQATDRMQTVDGELVPQRETRVLNFTGGVNLNLPIGQHGRLSGQLSRSYRGDRSTSFSQGVPNPSPRSEIDYWNGQLSFTWNLQ